MTVVLVDSNVILDLFDQSSAWYEWSREALQNAADRSRLVINPIVYAEVSVGYERPDDVNAALPSVFEREPLPYEAAFLAGKAFASYRKRAGTKTAPLPDFFIGAHAAVTGYVLLTRDVRRYRSYFSSVNLIAPNDQ